MADELEVRLGKARRQVKKLTPSLVARAGLACCPLARGTPFRFAKVVLHDPNMLGSPANSSRKTQMTNRRRPLKRIESKGTLYA
jgi:hypothetical protein